MASMERPNTLKRLFEAVTAFWRLPPRPADVRPIYVRWPTQVKSAIACSATKPSSERHRARFSTLIAALAAMSRIGMKCKDLCDFVFWPSRDDWRTAVFPQRIIA